MRGIEWVTITMLNIVPVLYFTSSEGNIIFLQYVDFSLGLHENYIFQWPFAVNFKKLNCLNESCSQAKLFVNNSEH